MNGALTETQRAWNLIREAADEAARTARLYADDPEGPLAQFHTGREAGLVAALHLIEEIDPDADCGPAVPGRVYGRLEDGTAVDISDGEVIEGVPHLADTEEKL
jgi:hypothetical protein